MSQINQKLWLVLTIFCMPLPALAGRPPTEAMLRAECSEFSQAGMHECLEKKAQTSAIILLKAERKAHAKMAKWDTEAQFINLAQRKLKVANREFIRYRAAQCEFNRARGSTAIGNALEMGQLACVTELNLQRAAQITAVVSNLPLK